MYIFDINWIIVVDLFRPVKAYGDTVFACRGGVHDLGLLPACDMPPFQGLMCN